MSQNSFIARKGLHALSASTINEKLTITGSTSGSTVLDIQGTQGQLFSITDSLIGDIFAVSDISGIPILNVNSDGTVTIDDSLTMMGGITMSGGTGTSNGIIFGDGDTGIYENPDDTIVMRVNGGDRFRLTSTYLDLYDSSKARIVFEEASTTNPVLIPSGADIDTGIGGNQADQLSLIAGGKEMLRLSETGTAGTDQLIIAPAGVIGAAGTPSLAFGDGDSGFYEYTDDRIILSLGGATKVDFESGGISGTAVDLFYINLVQSTSTVPAYAFDGDTNTGVGHAAADQLSLIAGGVEIARAIEGTNKHFIINPDGDTGTDSGLYFGDGDTGFYEASDDTLTCVTGGNIIFYASAGGNGGLQSYSSTSWGLMRETPTTTNPVILTNRGDTDTGIGGATTGDQFSLIAGAKEIVRLYENVTEQIIINPQGDLTGTAAAPSLAFGDGDTGFYEASDDTLSFTSGTDDILWLNTNGMVMVSGSYRAYVRNINPTSTAPVFTFNSDTDTGIGHADANQLSLIAGATEVVNVGSTSVTINQIPAGTADYDTFLVSHGGIVKSRTGAEVLSDIGAQASGSYVNIGSNPVDNRIAVWSNGTTIEGDSNFTWDGTTLTVGGNLTVAGTTSTINSTTVTIDDPIFTIGGDTIPTSDDNKDRGIEFRWHTGSAAKVGFFGYDDSTGKFTFIPDATNTGEVFSGTKGTLDANLEWSDLLNTPTTLAGYGITDAVSDSELAAWVGSTNITTLGTITTGVWNGTALTAAYVPNHDSLTGFVSTEHVDHSGVVITAGTGLSGGGDITVTRTLNIDYLGTDNVLYSAPTLTSPATADYIMYHDVTDNNVKKALISSMPFDNYNSWRFKADGAASGDNTIAAGDTLNFISGSGITMTQTDNAIETSVDYFGTDNVVLAPLARSIEGGDYILFSDSTDNNVYRDTVNNLPFNNYSHPTHPGDDFSVDSGVLSGAWVVSDIDINVTTDTLGHVTDANGTISTRQLTASNIGAEPTITNPNAPQAVDLVAIGDEVTITFTGSTTSDIDAYEIWGAVGAPTENYNLIGRINEDGIATPMSIVDSTFNKNDDMYYKIYAIKHGNYSDALTGTTTVSGAVADVSNMSVTPTIDGYWIKFDLPEDNRLLNVEIRMDSNPVLGSLAYGSSSVVYTGLSETFFYKATESAANDYHQFWVDSVVRT